MGIGRDRTRKRRGQASLIHKREKYFRLVDQGTSFAEVSRVVSINLRTGKRWRNGRHASGGRKVVPPVNARALPSGRSRYLREADRIHKPTRCGRRPGSVPWPSLAAARPWSAARSAAIGTRATAGTAPCRPGPARTPAGRAPSSGGSDRTLICGSFILRILAALHKNQATSAKATRRRVATTAAPTSAAVKRMCGSHICVATAYQGTRYVQDITVLTRDGLPGTLRAFAGSYRQSRANDDEEADYRICVGEDQLDSLRFAALLADSRRHAADGRLESAIGMIWSALALWRGPALDGLGGSALSGRAARLDEQRLGALELCARWRLEGGQHQEVVDELSDLVPSHPLREGLHAQLITALDRCGRRAEALHAFHRLGTSLAQELGVGPGAGLQRLHEQILSGQSPSSWPPRPRRDDAVRTATPLPAPRLPSTTTAPPAPRQLPHAIRDFTGRTDHLAALDAALLRRAVMSPVAVRRWRSPRSTARAAWERRPSRCTGPTGSSTGSPTERSAQTCAGTGPAGPRPPQRSSTTSSSRSASLPQPYRPRPRVIRLWENAWAEFVPFLSFDVEIRKVICSTNAIDSWVVRSLERLEGPVGIHLRAGVTPGRGRRAPDRRGVFAGPAVPDYAARSGRASTW